MKSIIQFPKAFLFIIVFQMTCLISFGQKWTQLASLPVAGRDQNMGFSINGKGYLCGGNDGTVIFRTTWEYDPVLDAWTQKANMPQRNNGAATFTIDSLGYVIGGYNFNNNELNVLWCFNPISNVWTNKTSFPSPRDNGALAWSINGKGYVGCGWDGSGFTSDIWEYNPTTDAWTAIAPFPGGNRAWVVSFVIDNIGYAGLGENPSFNVLSDFYSYNPATNLWLPCANFPGTLRSWAFGFALGNFGYTGGGASTSTTMLSDWWQYNPANDSWMQQCDMGGGNRAIGASFTINNTGYIATGRIAPTPLRSSELWKFEPDSQIGPVISGNSMLCLGETIQLTATGASNYLWSTGDTVASIFVSPLASQVYSVSSTSVNCTLTDSIMVSVMPLPMKPNVLINADTLFCIDSSAFYQWYLNGNLINGAQQSYITGLVFGTYTVAVTDSNGCSAFSDPFILSAISDVTNQDCFKAWVANNQLNIVQECLSENQELAITIFSNEGRNVLENKIQTNTNTKKIQIPLPTLTNGMYVVRVKGVSINASLKVPIFE